MNKHKAKINPPSDGLQCCYVARRKGTGAERTCSEVFYLINCLLMVDLHWIDCLIMVDCSGLKEGGKDILVATDVAGRGTIQSSILR